MIDFASAREVDLDSLRELLNCKNIGIGVADVDSCVERGHNRPFWFAAAVHLRLSIVRLHDLYEFQLKVGIAEQREG